MKSVQRWRPRCLLLALMAATVSAAWADTVQLNNGDRLTGTIDRVTLETVQVTLPYGGSVTLPRAQVKTLTTDHLVPVDMPNGTTVRAYLGASPDGSTWVGTAAPLPPAPAATAPSATTSMAVPAPAVAAPTPAPAPEAPQSLFGPNWKSQFQLGLVNASGNTDQTEFSAGVSTAYERDTHELTLKLEGGYGTTNGVQDTGFAAFDGVYREQFPSWKPQNHWYGFGETHDLYDGIKGISFRTIDAAGLGYYLWKGERLSVDVRVGPGILYEKFFDGSDITDPVVIAGLRASYKFSERVSLTEDLLYTQSASEQKHYQVGSQTDLNVKLPEIMRGMGVKFGFRDDYDNTAGSRNRQANDTRFVVAMTLDF